MLQYSFLEEPISKIIDELELLTKEHHVEVGSHLPMKIDWAAYVFLQEQGILFALTVRKDGKIVGYCTYVINEHLRYRVLMAVADVYFVHPSERGITGLKMLKKAEELLRKRNVKAIVNHCKVKNDFGKIFERMGYKPLEKTFIKYFE